MECQIDRLGKVSITVDKDYWNINKAYDKLVAVERDGDCAYLSRKPVPAGILITNREYWIRLGFSSSGGVIAISQNFGYDPGIAISQKAITERFEELENIINELITGGITVDVTFDPSYVTIDTYSNVTIYVELNKAVDSIIVLRNNVQIEEEGSGDHHSVTDHIEPTAAPPIKYTIKVTKDGVTKTVYAELPVNKKPANIEWRLNGSVVTDDSVLMGEVGHSYPVLYIPDELDASKIQYVSETPFVASVNNKGVPTPSNAGTTRIHAIYTGDDIYGFNDIYYTLEVSRGDLSKFEWYDPTTGISIMSDPTWQVNKDAQSIVYPSLRVSPAVNVQYTTVPQNSTVATVNSNGVPRLKNAGSVVIKASFTGNDNYNPANAEYTLVVKEQQDSYWEWVKNGITTKERELKGERLSYAYSNVPTLKFVNNTGRNVVYGAKAVGIGTLPQAYFDPNRDITIDENNNGIISLPTERIEVQSGFEFMITVSYEDNQTPFANLSIWASLAGRTFRWNANRATVNIGSIGAQGYTIPSESLPVITDGTYAEITSIRELSGYTSNIVEVSKKADNSGYTVKVTDNITDPEGVFIKVEAYSQETTQYSAKSVSYDLTILPPLTPDYYVGWTNGTKDAFRAKDIQELVDNAERTFNIGDPSYNEIASDIICYVIFRESNPPTGEINSAGIVSPLSTSDFLSGGDTKYDEAHDNIVTINDIQYKIWATRNTDYKNVSRFIINF